MRRLVVIALIGVVAAIGAACSSSKPASNVGGTTAPSPSSTGRALTDSASPRASTETASPLPLQSGTVFIVAREFAFEPDRLRLAAGETTFKIKNEGKAEHEFEIFRGSDTSSQKNLVEEVEGIAPGITRDLKADLTPGDYTYVCKISGHEESGQRGSLTVV